MDEKSTKKIGRRDLLKVMTASAGALTVSAFLPKKWSKPVVDFGVSPVHAAASITTGTIQGTTYLNHALNKPTAPDLVFTWFPMAGATVSVDGMPALKSTSNINGVYTITNVPIGSQTITCVPPQDYYFPIDPNPASNVPVTVSGITPATQDFHFEDQG